MEWWGIADTYSTVPIRKFGQGEFQLLILLYSTCLSSCLSVLFCPCTLQQLLLRASS